MTSDAGDGLPSPDRLAFILLRETEGVDFPLREFVRTLDRLAPAASLDDKVRLARRALPSFLNEYDLWRGRQSGGPFALMTEEEVRAMAHDDACWHDGSGAAGLAVWLRPVGTPTPEGH